MKTAKELLLAYLENVTNVETTIELFADDAAIELPYLSSLDKPWRWQGRDVLYNFIKNFPGAYENFAFKNIKILIDTPNQVFAEYEVELIFKKTGNTYRQTYMGRLVSENGRIKLLREGMDLIAVQKAFTPKEEITL